MRDYADAKGGEGSTLGMRIAAGVMLFFASAGGVWPPLLRGPASADLEHGKAAMRMKAFAAGVMLGLAIMHVIADAFADMADLMEYPVAGLFVVGGLLFMFFVENVGADVLASMSTHASLSKKSAGPIVSRAGKTKDSDTEDPGGPSRCDDGDGYESPGGGGLELDERGGAGGGEDTVPLWAAAGEEHAHAHVPQKLAVAAAAQHAQHQGSGGHSHGMLVLHPMGRKLIVAHLLEFGVVVHSVIIGLDLGVMTEDRGGILGLAVVLMFHQFFEGVSLGSYIADLGNLVPLSRKGLMALLFCATTPLGVFIGVGVSESYEPDSVKSQWIRGACNGLTGGMLLYMTLISFIGRAPAVDLFGNSHLSRFDRRRLKYEMYALLLAGVALMELLALWA